MGYYPRAFAKIPKPGRNNRFWRRWMERLTFMLPNEDPARRFDTVNAVMIYSPDTGFVVDLTHGGYLL